MLPYTPRHARSWSSMVIYYNITDNRYNQYHQNGNTCLPDDRILAPVAYTEQNKLIAS